MNIKQFAFLPKSFLFLHFVFLCTSTASFAQKNILPSDSIFIFGQIKQKLVLTTTELEKLPKSPIKNQIITNHKGEIKDTLVNIKGVALKVLLKDLSFTYQKPKELNEFYIVLTATDNYRVVISWNELFNAPGGADFYIITEMNGKPLNQLKERMLLIAASDIQTGRRYVKGLKQIEVKRLE